MKLPRHRALWWALGVALALRVAALAMWPEERCTRDECTYIKLAVRMVEGQGMTESVGWLWAPGYPFLLAAHREITGLASSIKGTQLAVGVWSVALLYALARRALTGVVPGGRRAAAAAAMLYAASPVLVFFSTRLWSEVIYAALLMGGLLLLARARDRAAGTWVGALGQAAGAGAAIAACVLFRGVATYALPFFALGLLWRRWRRPRAWAQVAAMVAAAALCVAPYSLYASQKFGATVISDRTLGQMMWLGNNDFQPVTFDFGNGELGLRYFARHTDVGRARCDRDDPAVARDACEVAAGFAWIKENPQEFVRRMPVRVAQLLNPHSFLTRNLRWSRWRGIPQAADELLVGWGAAWSMGTVWLGALGLAAFGRGAVGVTVTGVLLYHVAAIAALAGLSRYRVPLEPLLMIYAGAVLASPRAAWAALRGTWWRGMVAAVALVALVPLVLWFLPSGWPDWRVW